MEFGINGRRVEFNHLDLYGDAVSLGGKGSMQLDCSDLLVDFLEIHRRWFDFLSRLPLNARAAKNFALAW